MLLAATLALVLGAAPLQSAPTVVFDGWTYGLSPQGTVVSRGKGGQGFADLAARHAAGAAARAKAPVWEVLVVVPMRADIVDRTGPFVQMRRGALRSAVEDVKREVDAFTRAAEALANGALRVRVHLVVQEHAERSELPRGALGSSGPMFLSETLKPLVNGAVFDPADPTYRGPFDSAFVLHPGLVSDTARTEVYGAPAASIPIGRHFGEGQLAYAMVGEWARHLQTRADALGFAIPDHAVPYPFGGIESLLAADGFMSVEAWGAIGTRTATTEAFVGRSAKPPTPIRTPWPSVRSNPWRLPSLSEASLSQYVGTTVTLVGLGAGVRFQTAEPPRSFTGGIDDVYVAGKEAAAAFQVGSRGLVFVEWRFADLFGSHFSARTEAAAIGTFVHPGFAFVVFEVKPESLNQPELNLLTLNGIEFDAPPQPRGEPTGLGAGITAWAPQTDALRPTGPTLVEVARGGTKRFAAVTAEDPLELTVPEFVLLSGDVAEFLLTAIGSPDTQVAVRFEAPPGWIVPSPPPLVGGQQRAEKLTAPPGPLSQEVRVHFEGPNGWHRVVPVKVHRPDSPVALDLELGGGNRPTVIGAVEGVSVNDPCRGEVAHFRELGQVRSWQIDLLKREGGHSLFFVGTHRFLELTVNGTQAEPIDLMVVNQRGVAGGVRLFEQPGSGPHPTAWTAGTGAGWETLVFDLQQMGVTGQVVHVYLQPPMDAHQFERPRNGSEFSVARIRVLTQAQATPIAEGGPVQADAKSTSKWARARAAAEGAARELMNDPNELVALNVAAVYRAQKDDAAVAGLALSVRSLEPAVVREAVLATAHQDTPAAWVAVKAALDSGPSDEARAAAAESLIGRNDLATAATLTSLIVASHPEARIAGVAALAAMTGTEPAQMVMVFLQDADPAVRLEVVRRADVQNDTVARRVQYESVNDPSDAVRAASYLALIRSKLPGFADEGYRGVRDDSPAVRLALLEVFRASPAEAHRRALQLAVADTDPRVRAAALRAFAALPGNVTLEELGGVLTERDPRVQRPLIALADAKKLVLPPEALNVLRGSVDSTVAEWARAKGDR